MQFVVHPQVYATGALTGLRQILEKIWIADVQPGVGTIYMISGFANFNGGARFYSRFTDHTDSGGRIVAYLGGSSSQRLSSKQVVEALLECGVEVNVINRKRIMHAKCYGHAVEGEERLVVTSGNFTGPGMALNVEASILVEPAQTNAMSFSWTGFVNGIASQNWQILCPDLSRPNDAVWSLLYDESPGQIQIEDEQRQTLVLTLSHADTARIQAAPDTNASKGSQYFWLSKDSYDFFPPLTIRNQRGYKGTLAALVTLNYVDLGLVDDKCRVTFEAQNNLDFRLGTGKLRHTQSCGQGDIACISRVGDASYELRLFPQAHKHFAALSDYAVHFIGHQGKRYGYMSNTDFFNLIR